jgi:hypothetical protein
MILDAISVLTKLAMLQKEEFARLAAQADFPEMSPANDKSV